MPIEMSDKDYNQLCNEAAGIANKLTLVLDSSMPRHKVFMALGMLLGSQPGDLHLAIAAFDAGVMAAQNNPQHARIVPDTDGVTNAQ